MTRVLSAFFLRDFRTDRSYRIAFITSLGGAFTTLLSAGFLSRIVPGRQASLQPYGSDYFTFVLIGTAALAYFSVALGSFSGNLTQEQQLGTIETLMVSPNDPRLLLVCGAAWPFAFATVQLIIYIVVGAALFHAHIAAAHLLLATGVLALTLCAFGAVGLAAAGIVVVAKRVGSLLSFAAAAFALLGGVLYPISVLPAPLRWLGEILPMSHGLDGVRRALVAHPNMTAIGQDVIILIVFTGALVPLALAGFRWSVDRARRTGSLGHY